MFSITRRIVPTLTLTVFLVCSIAGSALASKSQLSVIEDSARLTSSSTAQQDASLDEMKSLGAEVVKIPISWRSIAPAVDTGGLTSPDAYPVGNWSIIDRVVSGATARGMRVWLMITAPAPVWAVGHETTKYPGSYRPDPEALGDFAQAVGQRYPDAGYFSIWNEPNLSRYLQPQYSRGVAQAAVHYRKMYRAAYAGLIRAGRSDAKILFGELKPRSAKNNSSTVMPILWLRDFFCLDKSGRKLTGSAAKKRECNGFKPIKASGMAYHPYAMAAGPLVRDKIKDNATIYYLKRIERVLDQASKRRRLSGRKLKIYSSEFGFQSDPPDVYMTKIERIPGFLNLSEYLSYKDSRVATYSQYQLVDDAEVAAFQAGLRFSDGVKKHDVYEAYQLPFNVFKGPNGSLIIWGALRASDGSTQTAAVQVKDGASWTTVTSVSVTSPLGYFEQRVVVPGGTAKTYRLAWNGLTSRETKPVKLVKAATD